MRIRTLEDLNDSLEFFGPGARHDKRSKEIALSALNSLSVTMVEGFWHLVSHCGTDMFVLLKFDSKKIAQHFDEALVGDLLNAARFLASNWMNINLIRTQPLRDQSSLLRTSGQGINFKLNAARLAEALRVCCETI